MTDLQKYKAFFEMLNASIKESQNGDVIIVEVMAKTSISSLGEGIESAAKFTQDGELVSTYISGKFVQKKI